MKRSKVESHSFVSQAVGEMIVIVTVKCSVAYCGDDVYQKGCRIHRVMYGEEKVVDDCSYMGR